MIGAVAGDVIGSRFEMSNYSANKSFEDYLSFPLFVDTCKFTDDTVLSCAIAKVLMEEPNINDYQQRFAEELKSFGRRYPTAGYGSSFIQWLDAPGFELNNSWGNGAAMRVSPVGFYLEDFEDVLRIAELSALPTHGHPEGIAGAQSIAAAIYMAKRKNKKELIKDFIENRFGYNLDKTLNEVRAEGYEFSSYARDTVPHAIRAFLEGDDYESTIRRAISIGGDSDTIACMAGGIAEAFYGIEGISDEIIATTFSLMHSNAGEELVNIVKAFDLKVYTFQYLD